MSEKWISLRACWFIILLVAGISNVYAQCTCNFTIPAGTGTYVFDGVAKGLKAGDRICLAAGVRERILFQNIIGSPANYVTVINCGGQALIGGPNANTAISFTASRYFRLTGSGDSAIPYGIKIVESKAGTQGVKADGLSSDMEFDHVEITKAGFGGFMVKSDPGGDCTINKTYERPKFTLYNVNIHDNYVHDIDGEGIYCGNSFFGGTTQYCGTLQYPHEIRGVKIFDNRFENCGWESIQVGSGVDGLEIHHNTVINYGVSNVNFQNGGIQVGAGSAGKVHNNFIKKGNGYAIIIQGFGDTYIYNNVLVNTGTFGIILSVNPTPLPTDIVPNGFLGPIRILNNTFVSPTAVTIKESVNPVPGNLMYNNLIVGGSSGWLQLRVDSDWKKSNNLYIPLLADAKFVNPGIDDYHLQGSSPAVNAGKDMTLNGVTTDFEGKARPSSTAFDVGAFEYSANQKPVVTVSANQSIPLPTNTTTITGSASDADGTIASYQWTKENGPAATLVNETTTSVLVSGLVEGVYVFRLTAIDNEGEKDFKDVTITVSGVTVNQPPVASGGGNKTITLPTNTAVLNGSASDLDGTVVSYAWTKITPLTATLTNANTAALSLTDLAEGVHTFRLTVKDDDGDEDSDDITVTVQPVGFNLLPLVSAGGNKNLVVPTNSVNLFGSASDPDGVIVTYAWVKQSGGEAILTNADKPTLQVSGLLEGPYVFRLVVTDDKGGTNFSDAMVNVSAGNQSPSAIAGNDKAIQLPTNSTTLTGSGTDSDGSVTGYLWSQVGGTAATLTNTTSAVLSVSGLVQGVYVFRLTVTDNSAAEGSDEITLTVQAANLPPVASAGAPKTLILPINSTVLNGTGTDTDGSIATYLWEKVTGPSATLTGDNLPSLSLSNLVEGSYNFKLTVKDNAGLSGTSQVSVVVFPAAVNQAPVVNAGSTVTLTLPINSTNLVGTASDVDGTINSYLWEKITGPAASLSGTASSTLSLTNLVQGSYQFKFTATDNNSASASSYVTVVVTNINQKPVVSAGDQLITLPTTSTTITASATDADGTISSYLWTVLSGPGAVGLSGTATPTLSVNGLVTGTYVFHVVVTDNNGATGFDDVNVNVQSAANVNPIASAGSDVILFLPTNSVNLSGSATDSDGTIASYQWIQLTGGAATLTNATTATPSVTNMVADTYTFRLTVTDNAGGTSIDDVSIVVNPASSNQAPVADAGPHLFLTLPGNSTNLIGSGSDVDGSITSYAWTKISGPSVTLLNENTPVVSLQDMLDGIYIFRLVVTDNNGLTSTATTVITVFPSTVNQAPQVTVGNNLTITLPNNAATLTAQASDPDGSIVTKTWTKQLGPTVTLSGEATSSLSLTNLVEGSYVFRILVTDNAGASSFAEVEVTVLPLGSNEPPIVNAGNNKTLFLPNNTINLDGIASDVDGSIASYLWSKMSGPAATLTNQNTPTVSLSNLIAGQYVFRLRATDNIGASSFDQITVTVFPGTVNQSPIANAGTNKTIVAPNTSTILSGSGFDSDGSIVSYSWTQNSGPAALIDNTNSPTLLVDNLTVGVFQFQLSVTDDEGATGSDLVLVTVVAEGFNQPPVADAGLDKVVNLPQSTIDISGAGFDPDGTIAGYSWTKKSGPSGVTLNGQTTSKVSLSGLVSGTYQFTLTITDNQGLSNSDDVKLTVMQASVNGNPIVNAGADVFIRVPVSSTTLTATASDVDGSIANYQWMQQSGATATLAGVNTSTLSAADLTPGTYVFKIEVTDNEGSTSSDEASIVVAIAGVNNPPAVLAGSSQSIALPINMAILNGSASDADGSVDTLYWTQQSGPGASQLLGVNSTTLTVKNLIAGTYVYRLTAKDNEGAVAFSETSVEVKAFSVPPTVLAGNDTTISLPNNFLHLAGEVIPGDAPITTYEWSQVEGVTTGLTGEYPDVALEEMLPGLYVFRLTVTDNAGITASDDIAISILEGRSNPLGASLILTPNGDAINDVWLIKNKNMIEGCPIGIFNTLGKKVYESDDYNNDWDGTTNGQLAREGDYYFVVECSKKTYSGALRIIR